MLSRVTGYSLAKVGKSIAFCLGAAAIGIQVICSQLMALYQSFLSFVSSRWGLVITEFRCFFFVNLVLH